MNKFITWLQILFCSLLLLVFLGTIIAIAPGIISNGSTMGMSLKEILGTVFGFIFFTAVSVVGLRNGIRKLRKGKSFERVKYDKLLDIHLSGKIEYENYRNLILVLNFKKPVYLIIPGLLILSAIAFYGNPNISVTRIDVFYFIGIAGIVSILIPIFTLVQIKRVYFTNIMFKEELNYQLNNDSISIRGNTFDSTLYWNHFYKMRESRHFFIFYHGEMLATLLEKKMFTKIQLEEFQCFIQSLPIEKE